MRKSTILWLLVACAALAAGLILFVAVMTANSWDFSRLDTAQYETNSYGVSEVFTSISITTEEADIVFLPSKNGKCEVTCYEQKNARHTVQVTDGTLTVKVQDRRQWYAHIGIHWDTPTVTIYLPKGLYDTLTVRSDTGNVTIPDAFTFHSMDISLDTGDAKLQSSVTDTLKVTTSTGSIQADSICVGSMELRTSSGNIALSNITCSGGMCLTVSTGNINIRYATCEHFQSDGDTGNINLVQLFAQNELSIQLSTGNVRFDACDAANIRVETDTGYVRGTLVTGKSFLAESNTGKISVPTSSTGGKCQIKTDTGDISLRVID